MTWGSVYNQWDADKQRESNDGVRVVRPGLAGIEPDPAVVSPHPGTSPTGLPHCRCSQSPFLDAAKAAFTSPGGQPRGGLLKKCDCTTVVLVSHPFVSNRNLNKKLSYVSPGTVESC